MKLISRLLVVALISMLPPTYMIHAAPLTVVVKTPPVAQADGFHLGTASRPDGATLTVDSNSLRLNGKPWVPAMGEFHYTRYPATEWREELLKMKAGGIDVVATYVFWIHHEEEEGKFIWSQDRDLRTFVKLCGELGLKAVVRCGPWCHGEVRNGGLPEWLVKKGWPLRSEDPKFLSKVNVFYAQIAEQLRGLLWKDGGPVIAIQLDNEYGGPAEYLLALKRLARDVGLDVPFYTRTGWPALKTPMPFGEIVPLYGAYAEGFWDRELTSMPGRYWAAFRFSTLRVDENIANEQLGRRDAQDDPDVARYPYLTCEVGGGMMSSYHRRILIDPADVESTVLVKLGSGSTLPGYYMYHGGTNPEGKFTTLMEAQDTPTTNWNDLPVKNYDFQAPLGQFGQVRPHYHLLRRLHLFLRDFGASLSGMPPSLPDVMPTKVADNTTLRWSVRSDGVAGFVFVNNYERSRLMPAKRGVQFALKLPSGELTFPRNVIEVPENSRFVWPFGLTLAHGVRLTYATAQPICQVEDGNVQTVFFAETAGIPSRFKIDGETEERAAAASRDIAFRIEGKDRGTVQIVLLKEADSLALSKGTWNGRERVVLSEAGLAFDGDRLHLTALKADDLSYSVYPSAGDSPGGLPDGSFTRFTAKLPQKAPNWETTAVIKQIKAAGALRAIPLGRIAHPVAMEPKDADFENAAVWQVTLPRDLDLETNPLLRLHYVGDVARVRLNGKLLTDDFYNGNALEFGLARYRAELATGELRVEILPFQKSAPIFIAEAVRSKLGEADSIAELRKVEIIPRCRVSLGGK